MLIILLCISAHGLIRVEYVQCEYIVPLCMLQHGVGGEEHQRWGTGAWEPPGRGDGIVCLGERRERGEEKEGKLQIIPRWLTSKL